MQIVSLQRVFHKDVLGSTEHSSVSHGALAKIQKKKRAMLVVNIEKEIVVKKNILECVCRLQFTENDYQYHYKLIQNNN